MLKKIRAAALSEPRHKDVTINVHGDDVDFHLRELGFGEKQELRAMMSAVLEEEDLAALADADAPESVDDIDVDGSGWKYMLMMMILCTECEGRRVFKTSDYEALSKSPENWLIELALNAMLVNVDESMLESDEEKGTKKKKGRKKS